MHHKPRDPDFERRVRASFARQALMETLGASLGPVGVGRVEITLPFSAHLTQQHGFVHGGVTAALMDSACGYAALSLMPPGDGVLTIEFKTNFLAPAAGESFRFIGEAVKSGGTVTVCAGEARAVGPGGERLIATMTATLLRVVGRDGVRD